MEKTTIASRMTRLLWAGSALFAFGSLAHAVEPRVYQLGDGGAIAPHLRIEIGNDDNTLRQNDGSDASSYVRLQPSLRYIIEQRNNRLVLSYAGDYYQYGEDYCQQPKDADCPNGEQQYDKASYQDHSFGVDGFLEISRKLRATLELQQGLLNEPLGTGLSGNASRLRSLQEPDSFSKGSVRAQIAYGAPLAKGELRFGVTHTNKKFDGFDNLSEESLWPSAAILYRVGVKTQVLAGISEGSVTGGNSERGISRQFVGVEVDASAITSGSFRLTNVREDFDVSTGRGDLEYVGWEAEVTWKPRRYSRVRLVGGRETSRGLFNLDDAAVATVTGDDIGLTTNIDIDWRHDWKERFSTDVGLRWEKNEALDDQAVGVLGGDAEDTTTKLKLEGNYSLRRWLDVGVFVTSDIRSGQTADRDYKRRLIGITANGTF